MAHYSETDYLLDRANIHDTVTKMYMLTDLKQWDRLQAEVPAASITLDYSKLFGSPPTKLTPSGLVEQWKGIMEKMTSTQHIVTSLLIDLPQPGTLEKPTRVKALGNAFVTLIREGMEGGDRTNNGGRGEFELIKVEGTVGNPWRIESFTALDGMWVTGNMKVLTG